MQRLGVIDSTARLSPNVRNWSEVNDKQWYADRMEVFAAMVDSMDQGVGRIVNALRDEGQLDNTLVLYLQDNGGCQEEIKSLREATTEAALQPEATPLEPDEQQFALMPAYARDGRPVRVGRGVPPGAGDTYASYGIEWANASNTPFREYKHFVHEGGISTPLIAHWPAEIKRRGELERQPGHLVDLMATCVDLAGAVYPSRRGDLPVLPREGVTLRPAFAGGSLEREQPIFFEHEGNRAVRAGDWKLVAKGKNGPWELYQISVDRSELNDLAVEHPEKVVELSAAWQAWAERCHVLPLFD
jgi:arylsulfatase